MIAVVFCLPRGSTHLWYHMFSPKDLENSYLTGFMVRNYINVANHCIFVTTLYTLSVKKHQLAKNLT